VNADCWIDCCDWCMVIWVEPDGPCHKTNAHAGPQPLKLAGEKVTVTANQVPGDKVVATLGDILPDDLASKLSASDQKFCFSLAAVIREELVEVLGGML